MYRSDDGFYIDWSGREQYDGEMANMQRDRREDAFIERWTAKLIKQGYSPERAEELAIWELHVRTGGD